MNWRKSVGILERGACSVAAIYFGFIGDWDAGTFFLAFGIFSAVTRDNEK